MDSELQVFAAFWLVAAFWLLMGLALGWWAARRHFGPQITDLRRCQRLVRTAVVVDGEEWS